MTLGWRQQLRSQLSTHTVENGPLAGDNPLPGNSHKSPGSTAPPAKSELDAVKHPRTNGMNGDSGLWTHPVAVWLMILGLIFTVEYAVMLLLPVAMPEQPSRILESAVDSIVLTVVLAPVLWWMVVRPLRQALRLQARFLVHSLASMENERRHIAHELHDGVGQSLTLLVSGLRSLRGNSNEADLCRRAADLQQLAHTALKDVKTLSLGLRPSLLDDLGLAPAIERVVADIRRNQPLTVTMDLDAVAGLRLPSNVETALFRIFQEAMNNVVKHSGARRAAVQIRRDNGMVILRVSDDGRGIAPEFVGGGSPAADHLGLTGMRERAALLGGQLTIHSAPGQGTCVSAVVPEGGQ